MSSIPTALAILVCDQVIVEKENEKKTLVGVFDVIWTEAFPTVQKFGFYAKLTDLEGTYRFRIRIIYIGDDERLLGEVESPETTAADRLVIIELALNLPPIRFPKAGHYELQLLSNEDYIGRAVIRVAKLGE